MKDQKRKWLPTKILKNRPDMNVAKDLLILFEEDILNCPHDWMDCVFHFVDKNYSGSTGFVIFFDEPELKKATKFLKMEQIPLWIYGKNEQGQEIAWQCLLIHNDLPEAKCQRIFVGAENLRKFCDKHNIFYKSVLNKQNVLMSMTDFLYLKSENEDCRIPSASMMGS